MTDQTLASMSLINVSDAPEKFARKVVVIPFVLEKLDEQTVLPHFLLSVITPKQKYNSIAEWQAAKKFRLPSGFSLIKGTREMLYAGQRLDIPPGFSRYFSPKKWDKKLLKDSKAVEIIARIDGSVPAISTAVTEVGEEAGIVPKHIQRIIDLGVRRLTLDGRTVNFHCFAMELKGFRNKKARDALLVDYFTYAELKQARKIRFRYNIPLVRPSHFRFIKAIRKEIKQVYALDNFTMRFKEESPIAKPSKKVQAYKKSFPKLIKAAAKGHFLGFKYNEEQTRKNIIKRSKRSRQKIKRIKKLIKR
ncbi:MAG: hypothetical protein HKP09_01175 [Enterobacterales bacterium]|nr:hypothetical protein [Enterobacterales bacterium]